MTQTKRPRRTWSILKPLSIGIFSVVFLFGAVGFWALKTNISGAVIAKGKVQVASSRTALQHPTGGVVAELLAENGDLVEAGDVVLRLDDTQLRSELTIIEGELFEALANSERLEAAIDDARELAVHPLLREASLRKPEIKILLDRQQRQLMSFYESLESNSRLLNEQIKQVENQISGVKAELNAKTQRMVFVEEELQRVQKLAKKGFVKLSVIRDFQKDQLTTQGDIGKLTAKIAELKGKISEIGLKLFALSPSLREKNVEKLNKLRREKAVLLEKRNRILNKLSKLEVRTPISGTIHDSKILGLWSVVVAAKPLMFVVPNDKPVSIAVQVDAVDIDQVFSGQRVSLKFSAFNTRSMPDIFGQVSKISADAFLDTKTQKLFYNVEVSLLESEKGKLGDKALISGMPVNAFLATKSRSPLEYMTRPIAMYFDRAFRDS